MTQRKLRLNHAASRGDRGAMIDEQTRRLVDACKGMSEDDIIAAHHADYYDETKPHVRKAFEQMGIDKHAVAAWVYRNIK